MNGYVVTGHRAGHGVFEVNLGYFCGSYGPNGRRLENSRCSIFGLLKMNYVHYGDVQWVRRVGDLSKITIHPLRANRSKTRSAEIFNSALQSKLRVVRLGVVDTVRRRSESPGLLYAIDFEKRIRLLQTKSINVSPPITISVRLIPYVDVGQMRVRRHRPGSRDQDKDFGVKQRTVRVRGSIGFRRCSPYHSLPV